MRRSARTRPRGGRCSLPTAAPKAPSLNLASTLMAAAATARTEPTSTAPPQLRLRRRRRGELGLGCRRARAEVALLEAVRVREARGLDEGLELLDLERGHVRVFVLHKYSRSLSLELRLRLFLGQSRGKRRRRRREARVVYSLTIANHLVLVSGAFASRDNSPGKPVFFRAWGGARRNNPSIHPGPVTSDCRHV